MPERYKNRIIRLISHSSYRPQKPRMASHALAVSQDDYGIFCQAVEMLRRQGSLMVDRNGCLSLPDMPEKVVGTFQMTSKGIGFVRPDIKNLQGDMLIPKGRSLDAATGDKVVAVQAGRHMRGRVAGRVAEVLSRANTQFTGTLFPDGKQWFVQPDGKAATEIMSVDDPGAKNAKQGDKVLVEILSYPTADYYAHAVIIERLGKSGTHPAELKSVIRRFDLNEKFSRTALNNTRRSIKRFNVEKAIAQNLRQDVRDKVIVTIDPQDARDFDDAISLKKLPGNCWQLGVHIADVSNFVRPGSQLDQEANQRSTSVYLPQHVIPMLPELLSNGVCSLQPQQDRFAKSVYIKLDENGNALNCSFANSVIRSTQRFTYEDVDHILTGKTTGLEGFDPKAVKLVGKMEELGLVLQKRRQKAGMLTLELPKAELVYDEKGNVIDAHPESTSFSHTIIEMFMLEANEAVARMLDSLNVPFLRRIHDEPDSLVAADLAGTIKMCGYVIPKDINRKGIQQLLNSVSGKPESFMINLAILKSLQKAEYSPVHIGHYALASKHYCHFTSPIRRYPDLTIHRLVDAYIKGNLTKETVNQFAAFDELVDLGQHCSERERNAAKAENDLRDLKLLQLLSKHIGDEIMGVVTSITNFGVFVQIEKYLIDGLILAADLRQYNFADKKHKGRTKANQRHRHRRFIDSCPLKLGQEIRVRIAKVNVHARTIDLVPAR